MSNKDKKETILRLWNKEGSRYTPISIVNKLQGEVTLKEVYHYLSQSEEAQAKHRATIKNQRMKDVQEAH